MRGLLAILIALSPSAAYAHDQWADGSPIPAWIKATCCGPADAHHLRPDQVRRVEGGYRVEGYPETIPAARALPSEDGDSWIFYRHDVDGAGKPWFSPVYCFFLGAGA